MRAVPLSIFAAALTVATGMAVTAAKAQSDVCAQLWVERNAIYKAYGYCFKTRRAISYFGNAGCAYDREGDIPLAREDRARIARIVADERAYGCR